jgi:hypothetical protein
LFAPSVQSASAYDGIFDTTSAQVQATKASVAAAMAAAGGGAPAAITEAALASEAVSAQIKASMGGHTDDLLDEKLNPSAILKARFVWGKPLSQTEIAEKEREAAKVGLKYVHVGVPENPGEVTFDADVLTKAFGGMIDFKASPNQHVHIIEVLKGHTSAPVPVDLTIHGVQGNPVHRIWKNDTSAVTLAFDPFQRELAPHVVYRMPAVNTEDLRRYGAVNIKAEASKLSPINGTSQFFVPRENFFGEVITDHLEEIMKSEGAKFKWYADTQMYRVEKRVLADITKAFKQQVLKNLVPTDITKIRFALTRGDRPKDQHAGQENAKKFWDATDATGLGSRIDYEKAHLATHHLDAAFRLVLIDPAKMRAAKTIEAPTLLDE